MKKIKILGMGNLAERSYFVFEKKLDFFPLFSSLLEKIKVEKSASFFEFDNGEINLEETNDLVENLHNGLYDIDIFYGSEKIIVVIRTTIPRKEYLKLIKKIADFKGFSR